jgi:hypothetical protein
MFRTPTISELMVWHAKNTSSDGLVRHPCDSKAWKHVHENIDFSFGQDDRNIHLGMAADGVNPFKLQRTSWSTWPVMLLNYNIPPWLTTKNFFHNVGVANPRKTVGDISILRCVFGTIGRGVDSIMEGCRCL